MGLDGVVLFILTLLYQIKGLPCMHQRKHALICESTAFHQDVTTHMGL